MLGCTWALKRMKLCGIHPKHQVLDNEASQAYKDAIQESGMIYQVVPPDDHRHNIEEKSIKTWKYHFIGVLIGNVATFPMNLWCQLTREISINTGKITRKHKNISLCTPIWAPRLQRTTICTHWDGHFNPQETDISQNIHRALQKGICTRDIL